jgi:asparagine synthase (glutamine-hydrolysing)
VRALLASELIPRKLDAVGLRSYLAYGAVQEPYTLVQGVQSLPAGHILAWRSDSSSIERYWQLPSPETIPSTAPADVLDQIRHQLHEAVRLQLVADVPLGAFLSGGIDSTAIAALMRRSASGPVKTFSVVFDEQEYDERHYAQIAAQHIGTEHAELHLRGDDVYQALPAVLAAFDQPSIDGVNTYFVSKATREAGLTVALSGLGGDELFGGYNGYRKPLLYEQWGGYSRRMPSAVRAGAAALIGQLAGSQRSQQVSGLLQSNLHPYFSSRQVFAAHQVAALAAPELLADTQGWDTLLFAKLECETQDYDPINRASALEMQTYMLSMLLRDADQMSMAHALELRVPLIDHVLVEHVFALPGVCKVDPTQPKPLLTRALNGALPDACVHRPKRGFTLPFAVWLRRSLQSEMSAAFLSQGPNAELPFNAAGLQSLWQNFERGQVGWSRVWGIYVLRDWLNRHSVAV